jgi:hypothetical protein
MGYEVPVEDRAAVAVQNVIAGLNGTGLPVARKVRLLQEWASDAGLFLSPVEVQQVALPSPIGELRPGWRGMARVYASTLERRTRILELEAGGIRI